MNDSSSLLTVPSLLHSFFSLTDVNTDIKLKKLSKNGSEMKDRISRATLIETVRVESRRIRDGILHLGELFAQKIPTTWRCGGDDDGGMEA